jgi:hypothetical protein
VAGHFDLKGMSGCTLRTHITAIADDLDFENKCRYAMKDGNCIVRLSSMPAAHPSSAPAPPKQSGSWGEAFGAAIELHKSAHAVADAIRETHMEAYVLHYDKILAAALRMLGPPLPKNMHPLSTFKAPFNEPMDF